LHHVVVESWARRASLVHARDARIKLLVLLVYLVALATTPRLTALTASGYAALAVAAILLARLPAVSVLVRAAIVLPFSGTFAIFSLLAGNTAQAANLVAKSYLSAAAVLVLIGATPLDRLLAALESFGAPRLLTLVVQFLYRYLFVISEQAQHMRLAAECRGSGSRRWRFRAAAGAVTVLFARSYVRAEGIHQAMLARGFTGQTRMLASPRIGVRDALFFTAGVSLILALRLLPGMLWSR
jgi:cobalt/nickel transport system permease protein